MTTSLLQLQQKRNMKEMASSNASSESTAILESQQSDETETDHSESGSCQSWQVRARRRTPSCYCRRRSGPSSTGLYGCEGNRMVVYSGHHPHGCKPSGTPCYSSDECCSNSMCADLGWGNTEDWRCSP